MSSSFEKMIVEQPPSPAQYDMLNELIKDTKGFLAEYDSIVLHKELYRILFLYTLSNLREQLEELLQKFGTLPKRDSGDRTVECCGVSFDKYEEFREHYEQSHNKKALQSASLCELKMSLTKITFFERRLRGYLKAGEISNCEMIMNLKRILKKINTTLEF